MTSGDVKNEMDALYERAKRSVCDFLLRKLNLTSINIHVDENGYVPGDGDYYDSIAPEVCDVYGVVVQIVSVQKDGSLYLEGENEFGDKIDDKHIKKTTELMAFILSALEDIFAKRPVY